MLSSARVWQWNIGFLSAHIFMKWLDNLQPEAHTSKLHICLHFFNSCCNHYFFETITMASHYKLWLQRTCTTCFWTSETMKESTARQWRPARLMATSGLLIHILRIPTTTNTRSSAARILLIVWKNLFLQIKKNTDCIIAREDWYNWFATMAKAIIYTRM